jgi:hypothetical protein
VRKDRFNSRKNNSQDGRPLEMDGSQYECLTRREKGLSGKKGANPRGDGKRSGAP